MSKNVQDEKPARSEEATVWLKQETLAQEARYKKIVKEIDGLQDKRDGWIAEFLEIIQTKGVNVSGDLRRVVTKDEIPEKPDRPDADRVIW